jgi:hypothetical protein
MKISAQMTPMKMIGSQVIIQPWTSSKTLPVLSLPPVSTGPGFGAFDFLAPPAGSGTTTS